jgi:hypothetical protein
MEKKHMNEMRNAHKRTMGSKKRTTRETTFAICSYSVHFVIN